MEQNKFMTLQEAEIVKQRLEHSISINLQSGLKEIEVFIAPSLNHDFASFKSMWRNSTYVVALSTYGHADMNVYVCDENYVLNKDEFETIDQFLKRHRMT